MAKIKLTKNELKSQREGLKRFERYLPTLQLKKQQLQMEVRRVRDDVRQIQHEESQYRAGLDNWLKVIGTTSLEQILELISVSEFETELRNIAGIDTPAFRSLRFAKARYDLFTTPMWQDELIAAVQHLVELQLRRRIIEEQAAMLEQELRVTTQRVNLFEKVKIPEARTNIRIIQIYLGDQQTSAVGRAKIAKEKIRNRDAVEY